MSVRHLEGLADSWPFAREASLQGRGRRLGHRGLRLRRIKVERSFTSVLKRIVLHL